MLMPPYRDLPVGTLLAWLGEALPDQDALVYPHRRWTFAELDAETRLIARGLLASGVEPGDRVVLWATNVPEWIVLLFALAKIGAILVTVNTSLRARELQYLLRQSEASTLITTRGFNSLDYLDALREIGVLSSRVEPAADAVRVKQVIFIGEECPQDYDRLRPYDELRYMAAQIDESVLTACELAVDVNAVINMQYTSGTTGFPKGVMLSSTNIVNNGYWLAQGLGYTSDDRLCLCVPLFHCFGCVIGVLGAYTHGVCVCPVETFDPRRVLETVERERCTSLYGVPTMFLAELEDPEFSRFDLSSLRTGVMAGAPCPEPLMCRVIDEMHLSEMTIAYGLTEASPGITQTTRDDSLAHRTQTVGRVLPEMEIRVVDPASGERLGDAEPGELQVRGYNVMKGYYNDPDATRAAIDSEGWLRTGDQSAIDADGYVRVTGRIKDLIIRGGENVDLAEVEACLRDQDAVADAYVYAISSERLGEDVAAAVRLRPGAVTSAEELIAGCDGKLAHFKIPRSIRVVTEFPMTASGKVQKFKLREMHERDRSGMR